MKQKRLNRQIELLNQWVEFWKNESDHMHALARGLRREVIELQAELDRREERDEGPTAKEFE